MRGRSGSALLLALSVTYCVSLLAVILDAKSGVQRQTQNVPVTPQLVASVALNAPNPDTPSRLYKFAAPNPVVPIRLLANTLIVSASLNRQRDSELLFDTGAENSITPETARKLGLSVEWGFQAIGFGSKNLNVGRTKIAAVQIGGVTLFNQTFYVVPLPYVVAHGLDARIVGVLGYQVLRNLPITINYQDKSLTLHDAQSFHYTGNGVAVPFCLADREPIVQGSIDGIPGTFRIDTGSAAPLSLFAPYVAGENLVQRFSAHLQGFAGEGLGGPESAFFARVHTLSLGGVEVHQVSAELLQDTKGIGAQTDQAGDVGAQALKRFNVTFDYPHRTIYFEKNAQYDEPDVFDRSGLALRIQRRGLVVMSVLSGSPAEQVGIRAGDLIIAVDAKKSAEITAPFLFDVFRQNPGTIVRLRVYHNGSDRDVSLRLRDIL